jgi:hypothetical protein
MAFNRNKKINKATIKKMLTTDSTSDMYSDKSTEVNEILQKQWLQMQQIKEEEEKCKKRKYKNKRKKMNQKQ